MSSSGPHLCVFTPSPTKAAEQHLLETPSPSSQVGSEELWLGVSPSRLHNPVDPRHTSRCHENAGEDTQRQLEFDESDSFSGPDPTFIPNNNDAAGSEDVDSSLSCGSNGDKNICELEIQELREDVKESREHFETRQCSERNAQTTATEDYWSSLFCDPAEFLWDDVCISGSRSDESSDHTAVIQAHTNRDPDAGNDLRGEDSRRGGLPSWEYASAFEGIEMHIDDIDADLGRRFVFEANAVLENSLREVSLHAKTDEVPTASSLSRLELMNIFLPETVLTKLRNHINRVLKARNKALTSVAEIKLVIVTHVLAASYHACVSTINAKENSEFFFQTTLAPKRYLEVWSALSGSSRGRQRVEALCEGWSNKPVRGNELITELEHDLAVVNRSIVYVPGKTIFSLDDDHQKLRSRAVTQLTNLAQVNNPKKALGPVNNAVCSALTSAFIASHYTRPGEKLIHIWERLVQLIQGAATPGSLTPMTDAVFAADRGYNSTETIQLINERLGATAIGSHKRSLDYPFVFGDGPISKKHKGMIVSEKGCRAVYSATKKTCSVW